MTEVFKLEDRELYEEEDLEAERLRDYVKTICRQGFLNTQPDPLSETQSYLVFVALRALIMKKKLVARHENSVEAKE
jgi:hypothetical protein